MEKITGYVVLAGALLCYFAGGIEAGFIGGALAYFVGKTAESIHHTVT